MYTWCTKAEWFDEELDLYYLFSEHGSFASYDEARADAIKHGENSAIVLNSD